MFSETLRGPLRLRSPKLYSYMRPPAGYFYTHIVNLCASRTHITWRLDYTGWALTVDDVIGQHH